jgi:D-3-phosphoglycerate dehydrogenase
VREQPLDRAGLLAALPEADVLWVRFGHRIDAALLRAAPRLRAVVSATTGLDHIDTAAAAELGVDVLSLRGEREFLADVRATAEHTVGLLLALLRRIPDAVESTRAGRWDRGPFQGREVARHTAGILGYGRNGRLVARTLAALDARVLTHDPDPAAAERARADGVAAVGFEDLLRRAEILTIHVALEPATVGLVGREQLALLPRGAVLVNTSRGELVDEEALADALEAGRLAGAALDVIAAEPEGLAGRRLARSPNVILTPHIGGWTADSVARTEEFMARKLRASLRISTPTA